MNLKTKEQLERRIGELEAELTSERNRSLALAEQLEYVIDGLEWAAALMGRLRTDA